MSVETSWLFDKMRKLERNLQTQRRIAGMFRLGTTARIQADAVAAGMEAKLKVLLSLQDQSREDTAGRL